MDFVPTKPHHLDQIILDDAVVADHAQRDVGALRCQGDALVRLVDDMALLGHPPDHAGGGLQRDVHAIGQPGERDLAKIILDAIYLSQIEPNGWTHSAILFAPHWTG